MKKDELIPCPCGVMLRDDRTNELLVVCCAHEDPMPANELATQVARAYRRWLFATGVSVETMSEREEECSFRTQVLESLEYAYVDMYTCRLDGRDFTVLAPRSFITSL